VLDSDWEAEFAAKVESEFNKMFAKTTQP